MARKLSLMTWDDIRKEMSIAGEPEESVQFGQECYELAIHSLPNINNIPSIENRIFALQRVIAELNTWKKILHAGQHIH